MGNHVAYVIPKNYIQQMFIVLSNSCKKPITAVFKYKTFCQHECILKPHDRGRFVYYEVHLDPCAVCCVLRWRFMSTGR